MERYYEVKQINASGNGSAITRVLVINPTFEGMGIHATQVGDWDGRTYFDDTGNIVYKYIHIDPVDFMIIGNATCIEMTHPFFDESE